MVNSAADAGEHIVPSFAAVPAVVDRDFSVRVKEADQNLSKIDAMLGKRANAFCRVPIKLHWAIMSET
jgi:hypothetical protein